MISVTFDRAALSLADLVITSNPFDSTLHIPEDGIGQVGWDFRRDYAPTSAWQGGKALLSAVREAATLPLTIYAHDTTSAGLQTARAVLESAASQWAYGVTVTVDGVATVYHCEPAIPVWTAVDSGMVAAHMDRANLVIPVNP